MIYVLMKNYLKIKYLFAVLFSIISLLKFYLLFLGTRIFAAIITTTKSNLLIWWKENTIQFSNLMPVALKYLDIPGTSVCSERIFSKARQVVSSRRQRLLPLISRKTSIFTWQYLICTSLFIFQSNCDFN